MTRRAPPSDPPYAFPEYDSADPLFAGRLLGKRYDVVRLLGRGSLASTHLVQDLEADRRAAARIVHAHVAADDSARVHIRRLARAGLTIEHPNIVRTWSVAPEDEPVPYAICEYVDGVDLATLLHRDGPLAIPRALAIARDTAAALEVVHAAGIVSGNLRPPDILVEHAGGAARVYDFDSPLFGDRGLIGNPRYAAPEQLMDAASGPRAAADLFALGCILYEMLAAERPFVGDSPMREILQKTRGEWTPLRVRRPDAPRGVENVIGFLLSPEPAKRGTAAEALAELTFLAGAA